LGENEADETRKGNEEESNIDELKPREMFRIRNTLKEENISLNHDIFFLYRMDGELW
jgi:hypothetical protein